MFSSKLSCCLPKGTINSFLGNHKTESFFFCLIFYHQKQHSQPNKINITRMPLGNLNVQENPINYMRSMRSEIYISRFTKPSRQLTQDSSRGRMSLYQPLTCALPQGTLSTEKPQAMFNCAKRLSGLCLAK